MRRRQRKKSSSSVDNVTASNTAKDAHCKEKAEGSHLGDGIVGFNDLDSSSESCIRQWFSKLSWEERSTVTSIEDTAFLSTLVELALSSSSPAPQRRTSGSKRGGPKEGIDLDWAATVSLQDVERAYQSNLDQAKAVRFTMNFNADGADTSNVAVDSGIPKVSAIPSDEKPTESVVSKSKSQDKKSNVKKEKKCNDRESSRRSTQDLGASSIESDAFRIERGTVAGGKKPETSNFELAKQTISETASEPIIHHKTGSGAIGKLGASASIDCALDKLRVIFPSACQVFLNKAASGSGGAVVQNPTIALDPCFLQEHSAEEILIMLDMLIEDGTTTEDGILSDIRCGRFLSTDETDAGSIWLHLVKASVDKTSNTVSEIESQEWTRLPLSKLIVTRMEASVMAAYNARKTTTEEKPDPNATSGEAKVQKSTTHATCPELVGPFSAYMTQAVKERASCMAEYSLMKVMDPMRALAPKEVISQLRDREPPLILLPVSWLANSKAFGNDKSPISGLISWNEAVESSMNALFDDTENKNRNTEAVQLQAEAAQAPKVIENKGSQQSCVTVVTPDGSASQPSAKKNKKKKKKKKRKASNADQSSAGSTAVMSIEKSKTEIPKSIEKTPPLTECKEVVSDSAASLPKTTENKSESDPESRPASRERAKSAPDAEIVQGAEDSDDDSVAEQKMSIARSAGSSSVETASLDDAKRTASALVKGSAEANKAAQEASYPVGDDSAWETVESKSRGNRNRKFATGQFGSGKFPTQHSVGLMPSSMVSGSAGTPMKKGKRNMTSRRRPATRKMAKDIIFSVLDGVDAEVKRKKLLEARNVAMPKNRSDDGKRSNAPTVGQHAEAKDTPKSPGWQGKPMSMRDVVLGRLRADAEADKRAQSQAIVRRSSGDPRAANDGRGVIASAHAGQRPEQSEDKAKGPVKSRGYPNRGWIADQNTALTVPETLSGVSGNDQSSGNTDGDLGSASYNKIADKLLDNMVAGDSSSGDIAISAAVREHTNGDAKETSPAPPLPTLLGPGNTHSASSSVASSLEAPHVHHHCSSANENDVGYHLLDVCDRLTSDMDVFMGRRAVALGIRRRERGALLAALQDTASKLWTGRCHVEMYGSCATQLDLPSSDLDAVICGLDRNPEAAMKKSDSNLSRHGDMPLDSGAVDSSSETHEVPSDHPPPHFSPMAQYVRAPSLSPNAERVIRLAAELERQPWAVQVKAIPTATVPVVKILADPSKLPGAVASVACGGDWMLQQHHMAAQAAAAASGMNVLPPGEQCLPPHFSSNNSGVSRGAQSHFVPHTPPPWRGADVMNGLFQVDITFEGPEHGGIGSTVYSARVVQDACNETGLAPDRTPVVQAVMVLKELLAQRRLNEPFSGGLSSYALLLLVVAVLKERKAIRQEMERVEQQRLDVASEDTNSNVGGRSGASGRNIERKEDSSRKKREASTGKSARRSESADATTAKPPIQRKESNISPKAEKGSKVSKPSVKPSVKSSTEKSSKPETAKVPALNRAESSGGSSWASIARKNTGVAATAGTKPATKAAVSKVPQPDHNKSRPPLGSKVSTFADAVAKNAGKAGDKGSAKGRGSGEGIGKKQSQQQTKKEKDDKAPASPTVRSAAPKSEATKSPKRVAKDSSVAGDKSTADSDEAARLSDVMKRSVDSGFSAPSLFPQGSNDVLEVLCSGETTAGKLLMHFLLFYGQLFDSTSTVIDVSGKHHPDYHLVEKRTLPFVHLSPYVQRTSGGSIDPVTGMLTVDPLVVYDPLEGAENNNVARSCYAWSSIRWVFAQSYMTLASAVERNGTSTAPAVGNPVEAESGKRDASSATRADGRSGASADDTIPIDMASPLLELLLSF